MPIIARNRYHNVVHLSTTFHVNSLGAGTDISLITPNTGLTYSAWRGARLSATSHSERHWHSTANKKKVAQVSSAFFMLFPSTKLQLKLQQIDGQSDENGLCQYNRTIFRLFPRKMWKHSKVFTILVIWSTKHQEFVYAACGCVILSVCFWLKK